MRERERETNEENNDKDSDEPVGEDNTERYTNSYTKHEHGLKNKSQIIVYYRHLFGWVRHSQVIPNRSC